MNEMRVVFVGGHLAGKRLVMNQKCFDFTARKLGPLELSKVPKGLTISHAEKVVYRRFGAFGGLTVFTPEEWETVYPDSLMEKVMLELVRNYLPTGGEA